MPTAKFFLCHNFKSTSLVFLASVFLSVLYAHCPSYFRSLLSVDCMCQFEGCFFPWLLGICTQPLQSISHIADSRANFLKEKRDHARYCVAVQKSSGAFLVVSQLDIKATRGPKFEDPRQRRERKQRIKPDTVWFEPFDNS